MFEVRLKPGHPTGTYRRAGMEFTAAPVKLGSVPAAVAKDPWLLVTEIQETQSSKVQKFNPKL